MELKRSVENYRAAKIDVFDFPQLQDATIAGVFGDNGFGVKIFKNRFGKIGFDHDRHWTEVYADLREGKSSFLTEF